ncbi:MAG: RNA polymerase sigma factor [Sphingobacteriales bacterium]|jgi:RNA polymerase sigma-70 factor (ECF subfamily)|nr:MAG: RNA polymerase sigma factor [Sphingobacteriales bacterium]
MQLNNQINAQYNQLIAGCLQKKRDAQYKLYQMMSGKMFAVCLRYAKDRESAEDILQEGFVKIFNSLEKFRGDGSFEGWVRRIMVNTAVEYYRKNIKMYPIVSIEEQVKETDFDTIGDDLEVADIYNMINSLSPGYRTVFNLYVVEGYSHKEVAEMLNISEGTSKSQLARARYLLMEMVEKNNKIKISNVAK